MVSQLVKHERIERFETTVAKAKEVRRFADNMIQLGKDGSLSAARQATGFVRGDDVLHKIFTELAYRYKSIARDSYSGLAYTYHLQGNFSAAISYYHKALWLKPDDQFRTEMLNVALMDKS